VDPALLLAERFPLLERVFSRWVHSQMECSKSSPGRLRLLGVLHCIGPQIMSELSDELGVTARNITSLVDALEREGLVRRTPHPTDRRATIIELTEQGIASASVVKKAFTERVATLFRDLPQIDQHDLLRVVESLLVALYKRGQGGKRLCRIGVPRSAGEDVLEADGGNKSV
jgi:DNA-binding MarR family transcriptional regulator